MKPSYILLANLTVLVFAMTTKAMPSEGATVLMHKGISAAELTKAQIIKLPPGQTFGSLSSTLSDDQIIEMPSGTRMRVGSVRALQASFAKARLHATTKAQQGFKILPPPKTSGVPIKADESAAEILARPPSDIVTFPSGRSASVAQLRVMVPYIKQHYGIDLLHPPSSGRPNLTGPAVMITSVDDLKKIPKNAPASTLLETPKGTRITLGELRTAMSNSKQAPTTSAPSGESK